MAPPEWGGAYRGRSVERGVLLLLAPRFAAAVLAALLSMVGPTAGSLAVRVPAGAVISAVTRVALGLPAEFEPARARARGRVRGVVPWRGVWAPETRAAANVLVLAFTPLLPGVPGDLGAFDYFATPGLTAYGAERDAAATESA